MLPTYSIQRMVQFAETDMAGVMHFANYFRLMEEVEHAFYRSIGLSIVTMEEGGEVSWPRATVQCEYHAPARFEDLLNVAMTVTRIGSKSLSYEVRIERDETLIALGRVTKVCCMLSRGSFESIAIPPRIREKIEAAVGRLD